jgi:hypothetical protein
MTNRILFSVIGAILLLSATSALVLAWPNQPPDKVLISGPGIEGQVEVRDESARAIFRLGELEDLEGKSPTPPRLSGGYKIVRFFYGGEFNFAQLTYYPNPSGGRGYLYWEDGPMLQGDHTEYNQAWLYTKPDGEEKLRALLKQLGAKLNDAPPVLLLVKDGANANASSSDSSLPHAAQSTQADTAQTTAASELTLFSPVVIALLVGAVGVLGAGGVFLVRRGRRTKGAQ